MRTYQLLREFLKTAPLPEQQELPVYFMDELGELRPIRGCLVIEGISDEGFDAGDGLILFDRENRREKRQPILLKDLWAKLLKVQEPHLQALLGTFEDGQSFDVFNITGVSIVPYLQTSQQVVCLDAEWFVYE